MDTVMNLIYSISPRHTDEYYAQKARDAAALKTYRLCFKDVGGMLTPARTRELVRLIKQNIGDVPLEFHAHCNNGLGPFNLLEAVKEGVRIVHTAIPPLANGSSQPSVFNVVGNLRALGYKPLINMEPLPAVSEHFEAIAKREGLPLGTPHGSSFRVLLGAQYLSRSIMSRPESRAAKKILMVGGERPRRS